MCPGLSVGQIPGPKTNFNLDLKPIDIQTGAPDFDAVKRLLGKACQGSQQQSCGGGIPLHKRRTLHHMTTEPWLEAVSEEIMMVRPAWPTRFTVVADHIAVAASALSVFGFSGFLFELQMGPPFCNIVYVVFVTTRLENSACIANISFMKTT